MSEIRTLGPVGLNPVGEYQENTSYERLDLVSHNGSSYVALKETLGHEVTDTEYWQRIADGEHGDGVHLNSAGSALVNPRIDKWIKTL